jgi:hypothetical protein
VFEELRGLLGSPGSPLEVLLFVVAATLVTAGAAALVYVLALTTLWVLRGRHVVGFWRLYFPSSSLIRKHLADTFLWAVTAGLVILTLVVKRDLVRQIEDYRLGLVVSKASLVRDSGECRVQGPEGDLLARLFPLGEMPPELCGALEESLNSSVSSLLGPVVEAGRSAPARALVEEIARRVASSPGGLARLVNEGNLRAVCLAVLLGYVLWVAGDRLADLRANPTAEPAYGEDSRRLLTLALCLALLLVATPRLVGDTELLADSALGSLARQATVGARSRDALSAAVEKTIREQYRLPHLLLGHGGTDEPTVWSELGQVRAAVGEAEGRLSARLADLEARLAQAGSQIAAAHDDVSALRGDVTTLQQRLGDEVTGLRREQGQIVARLKEGIDRAAETARHVQESEARLDKLEAALRATESAIAELRRTGETGTLIIFAAYPDQLYLLDDQRRGIAPAVVSVGAGRHRVRDGRTERLQEVDVPGGGVAGVALPAAPPG